MMAVWDWVERTIVGLLGLAALAVGMWQILGRYLDSRINSSWGDEVVVYLMIWAIMIVASQLVRHDGHVRPDIVLRLLRPGAQRWLEVFNCLVAIAFCAMLVWNGWDIVDTSILLDERSYTALAFPMWIYDLSLPVGAGLMLLRYVIRLIRFAASFDPHTMSIGHPVAEVPAGLNALPPGH
jgi:C4-dicarboxylate transporter DctQ subunit